MPRGCCKGGEPTVINEGRHVDVAGSGTPQDPIVIDATTDLAVASNNTFVLRLSGNGDTGSPWRLEVLFAGTSSIGDVGDVDLTSLQDGYTLLWSDATGKFTAGPPVTAMPGAIVSGSGVAGDGSSGNPLHAVAESGRYLQVTTSGVGVTDALINRLVRIYSTSTARDADPIAPITGAISVLTIEPKTIWYWTGSAWERVNVVRNDHVGQMLALSGNYGGGPTTLYTRQLGFTTTSAGVFTVIPAGDLSGYAGVLEASVQPVASPSWRMGNISVGGGGLTGFAYRDNGTLYASAALTGVVRALLY